MDKQETWQEMGRGDAFGDTGLLKLIHHCNIVNSGRAQVQHQSMGRQTYSILGKAQVQKHSIARVTEGYRTGVEGSADTSSSY